MALLTIKNCRENCINLQSFRNDLSFILLSEKSNPPLHVWFFSYITEWQSCTKRVKQKHNTYLCGSSFDNQHLGGGGGHCIGQPDNHALRFRYTHAPLRQSTTFSWRTISVKKQFLISRHINILWHGFITVESWKVDLGTVEKIIRSKRIYIKYPLTLLTDNLV